MSIPKRCEINDCTNDLLARKMCSKHYRRWYTGLNPHVKTKFDKRPPIIEGDIAYLPLGKLGLERAIVDSDMAHLSEHLWCLNGQGYAITRLEGKLVRLHHMVLGTPPKGMVVDHISRDKLDNRLSNLRFATLSLNATNASLGVNNKSGYKSIHWNKNSSKWTVQIMLEGTRHCLGNYSDLEEAVGVRDSFLALNDIILV